jgi:hypothetical protein
MSWLTTLTQHLNLVPAIVSAVQSFQAIGHTKESTVQKVGQIIQVAASVGEVVPIPQVMAVSSLVDTIAQGVFNTPASSIAGTVISSSSTPAPASVPVGPVIKS